MKVSSYSIASSSENIFEKSEQIKTSVSFSGIGTRTPALQKPATLSLSDAAKNLIKNGEEDRNRSFELLKKPALKTLGSSLGSSPKSIQELKMSMIEELFYFLTGKHFSVQAFQPTSQDSDAVNAQSSVFTQQARPATASGTITTEQISYEFQSTSYSAKGVVNTADGNSIEVDISLNMTREAYSYLSTTMSFESQPVDPLIINYAGNSVSLTEQKFEFDLNIDGKMDNISMTGSGSGFLTLDKNGDGKINDGSELFGPSTGNGFDELRKYDSDSNGWIDENDTVYSMLNIWTKDENGNDTLFTLKELDIGAIYLGDVNTQFSLNGSDNSSLGTIRSTSLFLKDSGGAGTISHVDLSI